MRTIVLWCSERNLAPKEEDQLREMFGQKMVLVFFTHCKEDVMPNDERVKNNAQGVDVIAFPEGMSLSDMQALKEKNRAKTVIYQVKDEFGSELIWKEV